MNTDKKGILIITPSFSPNIGGVETHLDDLVTGLSEENYRVFVHTYSPITTSNVKWKAYEQKNKQIFIWRYRWIGNNVFHIVENYPLIDFLYLTPYLFLRVFVWLIKNQKQVNIIHAQGINAGIIGVFLKLIFKKKLIISTHAIYSFNKTSITVKIVSFFLKNADKILCLSKASRKQLIDWGIPLIKIDIYQYWLNKIFFEKRSKTKLRKKLKWGNKFTVLFVGRLLIKKGIRMFIKLADYFKDVNFVIIGDGPENNYVIKECKNKLNLFFLRKIDNQTLPTYYGAADLLCVPSLYPEGFGRVIMESLASRTPVLSFKIGAIPEIINEERGYLTKIGFQFLKNGLSKIANNPKKLKLMQKNCHNYAEKYFSKRNLKIIINAYEH